MDWLEDFKNSFGDAEAVRGIKSKGFYGSLEINFSGGVAQAVNVKQHIRAEAKSKEGYRPI